MLNCSICHIIIHKFFFNQIFRSGWGGGELKYLGTLPFGDPPSKSFPESKTFSSKRRGEGGLLFPKTKRPKIFSKTLLLHNGGLNLVFKTFFDLNFPKKFLIIPQFQHSQVGQLGPPFFLFFGGGGYSPGHGKTSGEVVWLGCAIVIALIYLGCATAILCSLDQGPVVQTLIG